MIGRVSARAAIPVALGREALLARAALRGETRGYAFDRRKVGPVRRVRGPVADWERS